MLENLLNKKRKLENRLKNGGLKGKKKKLCQEELSKVLDSIAVKRGDWEKLEEAA